MSTKKIQLLGNLDGGNADTVDGRHASDFAASEDVASLQSLVGDTAVATQITSAIADKADKTHTILLDDNQRTTSSVNIGSEGLIFYPDSETTSGTLISEIGNPERDESILNLYNNETGSGAILRGIEWPIITSDAANKGYVDTKLPLAGGTMTGQITGATSRGNFWSKFGPTASFIQSTASTKSTGPNGALGIKTVDGWWGVGSHVDTNDLVFCYGHQTSIDNNNNTNNRYIKFPNTNTSVTSCSSVAVWNGDTLTSMSPDALKTEMGISSTGVASGAVREFNSGAISTTSYTYNGRSSKFYWITLKYTINDTVCYATTPLEYKALQALQSGNKFSWLVALPSSSTSLLYRATVTADLSSAGKITFSVNGTCACVLANVCGSY